MTVDQVKTTFVADVAKYKKDIQAAQKVLASFVRTSDTSLNRAASAQNKLALAVQKTAQEQAKALTQELKLRNKNTAQVRASSAAQDGQTKSTQNFGRELYYAARQAAMVYAAVKTIGMVFKTGIDFNRFTQDSTMAFGVMMKSADKAKALMQDLYDFAVDSPLTFKETVESSRQLMAYGFAAGELVDNMRMLGTVSMATGHSLSDISYVYGTLKTQGRAYARDLTQFAMRGIPIYEELAKVMEVDVSKIQKMTSEGKIGFKEIEKAFKNMTEDGGRFAGMLEAYMKTLTGQLAQFGDVWEQSMGLLTGPSISSFTKDLTEMTQALKESQLGFQSFGAALNNIYMLFSGVSKVIGFLVSNDVPLFVEILRGSLIPALIAVGGALMGGIFGPIGLAVGAIGALSKVSDIFAKRNVKNLSDTQKQIAKAQQDKDSYMNALGAKATAGGIASIAGDDALNFIEKLRDEYAKYLAERTLDEKGAINAVVEYERLKKTEEAKKLLSGPLLAEAKKYIDEMANYEYAEIIKARQDIVDDYKMNYDKMEAKRLVDTGQNIMALADLEIAQNNKTLWEKLGGDRERYQKAYSYQDKLHKKILEDARAEKLDAVMAGFTENQGKDIAMRARIDIGGESASNLISTQLTSLSSAIDAVKTSLSEENIEAIEEERLKAKLKGLTQDQIQSTIDFIDALDLSSRAAKLITYDKTTQGMEGFWENLKIAAVDSFKEGGFMGTIKGMMATAAGGIQGTPVGNVMAGANPFAVMAEGIQGFISAISNTNPILKLVEIIGKLLMKFKPFTDLLDGVMASIMYALEPALKQLTEALTWLWNNVTVPFGNAMIDIINALTRFTNKYLGTHIAKLNHLMTTVEALDKSLQDQMLVSTMEAMVDKLNSLIDKEITSLQDLYEVGAMSAADYEQKVSELNAQRLSLDEQMLLVDMASYTTLEQIRDWVKANAEAYEDASGKALDSDTPPPLFTLTPEQKKILDEELAKLAKDLKGLSNMGLTMNIGGGSGGFASGTSNIPNDMTANVHKGEGIVPATFMDSIRAGELTLSGNSSGGGGQNSNTNVYITVQGSVTTENDLADTLARKIDQRRRRGYITA